MSHDRPIDRGTGCKERGRFQFCQVLWRVYKVAEIKTNYLVKPLDMDSMTQYCSAEAGRICKAIVFNVRND